MQPIVRINIVEPPDNLGRSTFFASWNTQYLNEKAKYIYGCFGQIFFGRLDEHLKYWIDKGYTVEYEYTNGGHRQGAGRPQKEETTLTTSASQNRLERLVRRRVGR